MFDTLIGNNNIKTILRESVIKGKVSHSYIFKGEEGIGKKLFAREFAKAIMCLNESFENDTCNSCIKFDSNSNPDFCEITPDGKKIRIEQIRKIQEKILEKPVLSNKKVYLIDDADSMTEEAQNCLLKTLEEPPNYAVILLIISDDNKLLATIKSRCLMIKFDKISNTELSNYLTQISKDKVKLLRGSFKNLVRINEIEEMYKQLVEIVETMSHRSKLDLLENSDLLYEKKENIIELLNYMNEILLQKRIIEPIQVIEKTKRKVLSNNNYEMCIDNLLIESWNMIHNQ